MSAAPDQLGATKERRSDELSEGVTSPVQNRDLDHN